MADQNKFRLQTRDLYLPPAGNSVKNWLRGCLGSCATIRALLEMAMLLRDERLGMGRPTTLLAVFADVSDIWFKAQFIVQGKSEVF